MNPREKTPAALALLVALQLLAPHPAAALPEEYEQESSFMASPQELNVFYGSIPNKKDETFVPLARAEWKNNAKYFLLRRSAGFRSRSYLIVKLHPGGLEIIDERFDNPFRHGDTPRLKGSLPLPVAAEIYRQVFGPPRPAPAPLPSPEPPASPSPSPTR